MIVLDDAAQVLDELFHLALEIGMQVSLNTSDHVVVLDQSSACRFFKDIQNHFAFAETVEERCQSSHIHDQTRIEQQVRIDTLKFVHDGTDVLSTFRDFNACRLFNAHAEGVTVLMSAQVIQTVCQGERLRIGETFVKLFDTPVNISADGIYLADGFTFKRGAQTKYSVS